MKKGSIFTIFFLIGAMLTTMLGATSCGNQKTSEAVLEKEDQTEQIKTDKVKADADGTENAADDVTAAPTDYVSEEEMELADYWKGSKEDSLAKVMKKAAQGEKVTIAVIGGSITQGTISSGAQDAEISEKKCYAELFFSWWSATFPDTEFTFINAGIGATDSYLGVHRVREEVLDEEPDLVLVEFAVNDSNTQFYKKSYDNLIRTIVKSENAPAVLLLFMAQTSIESAQENQSIIGFSYSLPMVSYRNVIKEITETGKYTEKDLSGDTVHPSALGHAITGEILWKYLNSIYENIDDYTEPEDFSKDAVTKECYTNARILDSGKITPDAVTGFEESSVFPAFPNGWSCADENGEIRFTTSFANLGILYYCQTDGGGGQYEVYVDGESTAVLDADFKGGWGNYAEAKECYTSEQAAEHEVIIKRTEDSTGNAFTLLGLLTSDGAEED
ncbi:MAG: SGNH/GDSL hydrolase family protein [Lachnospiraceae bacterium]|nr:SGNH/GDSL hydrolase family protein [Lachnospiraceae bacterium]